VHNLVSTAYMVIAVSGVIAILWLARRRALPEGRFKAGTALFWAVGPLAMGVIIFDLVSLKVSAPPEALWDFLRAYYPAGRAALHHDAAALKALIGVGAEGGFVNIPAVAYLFAPFGWLPPPMAATVFTIIGIGMTIAAWFMLIRLFRLELRERWLLALLFAVNGPLLNGVKFGNVSYFLILAFTTGLVLMRAQRSTAAGIVLGAAAVLKPPLALFGLFFLLRRDWRGLAGFAGVGVAAASLSLVLFGWALNFYWFQTTGLQYSHNWLGGFSVQSIPAFLVRLHEPSAILLDWSAKAPPAGEKLLAQAITGLIFLIGAFACVGFRSRHGAANEASAGERQDLQYLLTICLCLVCSPLSWAHYYAWLLVPVAYFLGAQQSLAVSTAIRIVGWVAIILVTPLVLWPQPSASSAPMTIFQSLAVSHYLLGGLLWFGLIAWWLMRAAGHLLQVGPRGAGGAVRSVTSTRFSEVSKAPPPL